MVKIKYGFPHFTIQQEDTGLVTVMFKCGHYCPVKPNADHQFHGEKLGISAKEACLLHELAHQIVALAEGLKYCPIVYNSAHNLPMPYDADLREWRITALSYYALDKPQHDWNGLQALAQIPKLQQHAAYLLTLFTTWEPVWTKY